MIFLTAFLGFVGFFLVNLNSVSHSQEVKSLCAENPSRCRFRSIEASSGAKKLVHDIHDEDVQAEKPVEPMAKLAKKKHEPKFQQPVQLLPPGNLPSYLTALNRAQWVASELSIIAPEKPIGTPFKGLNQGDRIYAILDQALKISPHQKSPIRAEVLSGVLKNAVFLGEASWDPDVKERVLLTFKSLRLPNHGSVLAVVASGHSIEGQLGIEGKYHTEEGKCFAAELAAGATAGFADATTQRIQNSLGGFQTEPTIANSAKQGAVTALSKTADRFAERARSGPEFTEIERGREISILIQEIPTETTGVL